MNMQHKFQQFLFMNPGVLQFINIMVDVLAACRSWYAQCTLCSRPFSGDRCLAPVVVQRQVPWLGRAETVEFRSCRFFGVARAMLGSTVDTCPASSRVAFGFFWIFYVIGWTRILGSILRPGRHVVDNGSGMFQTGFGIDAPCAVFP